MTEYQSNSTYGVGFNKDEGAFWMVEAKSAEDAIKQVLENYPQFKGQLVITKADLEDRVINYASTRTN